MKQQLKSIDILALGFMLFAFFLGAGNIIFPPLAGLQAGENLPFAMFGFALTAVGLPLLCIIAIALAGGGWEALAKDLPRSLTVSIAVIFFIVIGPAFATPRTGLVAFETGIQPFLESQKLWHLSVFSVLFFGVAMAFCWYQGKLLDVIGKILTPVLFVGLVMLSVAVVVDPQSAIVASQGGYSSQPLTTAFLEGYNTMDTFGALMFGTLVIEALKSKQITEKKQVTRYVIYAAFIAAIGLTFVYVSLFYLGATSANVATELTNGGAILAAYVQALFGEKGQLALSLIVVLACLTTAIGLISACSDYFSRLCRITYHQWVLILGVICCLVANVGLTQLIALSVPLLYALYPVAIVVVLLTFIRPSLNYPRLMYCCVVLVAFLFALIDASKAVGGSLPYFSYLPLFNYGLAWLLPSAVTVVVILLLDKFFLPSNHSISTQNS